MYFSGTAALYSWSHPPSGWWHQSIRKTNRVLEQHFWHELLGCCAPAARLDQGLDAAHHVLAGVAPAHTGAELGARQAEMHQIVRFYNEMEQKHTTTMEKCPRPDTKAAKSKQCLRKDAASAPASTNRSEFLSRIRSSSTEAMRASRICRCCWFLPFIIFPILSTRGDRSFGPRRPSP